MSSHPLNVLFVCTGNSARSIMAEALLNRLGRPKFKGYSAGSHPDGFIRPQVLELLRRQNFRVDDLRSKDWAEFAGPDAPELTFVFTLCDSAATETCPVWPGQLMTAHWGMPDPAALDGKGSNAQIALAYADAFRMLRQRIDIFTNLPLSDLEPLALQDRLDAIGRSGPGREARAS